MAKAYARRNLWPKTENMNPSEKLLHFCAHTYIHSLILAHEDKLEKFKYTAAAAAAAQAASRQPDSQIYTSIYLWISFKFTIHSPFQYDSFFESDSFILMYRSEVTILNDIYCNVLNQKCMTLICRYSNALWSNSKCDWTHFWKPFICECAAKNINPNTLNNKNE